MMPGRAADRRRGAVPRQQQSVASNDDNAMLFADMNAAMEKSESPSWFFKEEDQEVLAGPYENVHIYMTDKNMVGVRKWVYTKMRGTLRLVKVQQFNQYPCVFLRLTGTDEA